VVLAPDAGTDGIAMTRSKAAGALMSAIGTGGACCTPADGFPRAGGIVESFNQVVTPVVYPLLYSPLRTGMPLSEREESDACMSPMPE
jgi:hypothetical protein